MSEEVYVVTSIEQVKVLSNKIRMKMFEAMGDDVPRTSKMISEMLGIPPNKGHYHVQELVRVGLFLLTETREKGGVVEKYYVPVAKKIRIALQEEEADRQGKVSSLYAFSNSLLKENHRGYLSSLERYEKEHKRKEAVKPALMNSLLRLPPDEMRQFMREFEAWFQAWETRSKSYDETVPEWKIMLTAYPEDRKQEGG